MGIIRVTMWSTGVINLLTTSRRSSKYVVLEWRKGLQEISQSLVRIAHYRLKITYEVYVHVCQGAYRFVFAEYTTPFCKGHPK